MTAGVITAFLLMFFFFVLLLHDLDRRLKGLENGGSKIVQLQAENMIKEAVVYKIYSLLKGEMNGRP
ncbi:MAG: hypothetical protein KAJ75_04855 [Alphaproteobacteria bacterium]|nr:hypothetical protein [Alphaproteobacteria bacterium]